MGTMIVTGTASGTPSSQRKKPARAVRGNRRHAIQKLRHYLVVIQGQDLKEGARAEQLGYTPYLFGVRPSNAVMQAMKALITRCDNVLTATTQ